MTEYVLSVAVALGYGIWYLALVREERQRTALATMPGVFAALVPAARQAARDIESVGRAFAAFAPAARRVIEAAPLDEEARRAGCP